MQSLLKTGAWWTLLAIMLWFTVWGGELILGVNCVLPGLRVTEHEITPNTHGSVTDYSSSFLLCPGRGSATSEGFLVGFAQMFPEKLFRLPGRWFPLGDPRCPEATYPGPHPGPPLQPRAPCHLVPVPFPLPTGAFPSARCWNTLSAVLVSSLRLTGPWLFSFP